jgi:hypothetical protein
MTQQELRGQTFAFLRERGFMPANSLPPPEAKHDLRPRAEIGGRLAALDVLFRWTATLFSPEEPSNRLVELVRCNQLQKWLTGEESAILSLPRESAQKEYSGTIGWKLENMCALAWVLGHDREPTVEAEFTTYTDMLYFLAGADDGVSEWVNRCPVRSPEEVGQMEYRFYCAHNAVRSAQLGDDDTVPDWFDPVLQGGVIYERRHALTWCMSPDVAWQDTDLNT